MLKSMLNLAAAAAFLAAAPALAQVQTIDPNQAYQSDPVQAVPEAAPDEWNAETPAGSEWAPAEPEAIETETADPAAVEPFSEAVAQSGEAAAAPAPAPATVPRDDVFTAAESVFGRGAEGLARLIEDILHDQGEPTAYISGQEAGGAFVVGVRYGSGTMHHQIEGDRAVYWTGPSLGFDFGADANKVFVLVYNLHDSQDLFKRYPGGEGHAYFVGGFNAQYLRRGDVVLIPIRMGVGLRLGLNAGYMRFSQRNRWLPF
jgi:hypothetical protein